MLVHKFEKKPAPFSDSRQKISLFYPISLILRSNKSKQNTIFCYVRQNTLYMKTIMIKWNSRHFSMYIVFFIASKNAEVSNTLCITIQTYWLIRRLKSQANTCKIVSRFENLAPFSWFRELTPPIEKIPFFCGTVREWCKNGCTS